MNVRFLKFISSTLVLGLMLVVGANLSAQVKTKGEVVSTEDLFKVVTSSPAQVVWSMMGDISDINVKNDEGLTLLMAAALSEKADPLTVETLLAGGGADIQQTTKDGKTVFDLLASSTSPKANIMKEKLLSGWLHQAARVGTVESMQKAIEAGADVNALSGVGSTPLNNAIDGENEHLKKVQMLVVAGADINGRTSYTGLTPLVNAVSDGRNFELIKYLLQNGADVNATTDYGFYPLVAASYFCRNWQPEQHVALLELLLDNGAKITHGADGYPTIFMASTCSGPESLAVLLKNGADTSINASYKNGNGKGQTALMVAARSNPNPGSIKMLLNYGADPNLSDSDGRNSFDYAELNETEGKGQIIEILQNTTQ